MNRANSASDFTFRIERFLRSLGNADYTSSSRLRRTSSTPAFNPCKNVYQETATFTGVFEKLRSRKSLSVECDPNDLECFMHPGTLRVFDGEAHTQFSITSRSNSSLVITETGLSDTYVEFAGIPDDPDGFLALVNRLRLGVPDASLATLKETAKLLEQLLENEQSNESAMRLETILYSRIDKLIDEVLDWKFDAPEHPENKERSMVASIYFNHVLPRAELLQLKWQLKGESYINIDNLRLKRLNKDGELHGIWLNPGIRPDGYRWQEMPHNYKAQHFGDMDFEPGEWWLNVECACRDGIIETPDLASKTYSGQGIFALVLANGKEEVDLGRNVVNWTRQGKGRDMKFAALTQHGQPIRLLRSYTLQSPFAPKSGVRYDGMYFLETYSYKCLNFDANEHELKLTLRRQAHQTPMREILTVPKPSQMDDWWLYEHFLEDDDTRQEDERLYIAMKKIEQVELMERAYEVKQRAVHKYLEIHRRSKFSVKSGF